MIQAGIRILLYSGDTDSVVSYFNTQSALKQLNLNIINEWRPWLIAETGTDDDGQVGGYVTEYTELTFTTIRGAGHMVPQVKPKNAYQMFIRFLNEKEF